MRDMDAL